MDQISGTFLLVGASRGLGWATAQKLSLSAQNRGLVLSRKSPRISLAEGFTWASWDAAGDQAHLELMTHVKATNVDRLIYFVGGGPFGPFEQKQWKDHEWSWQVGFLTPARLLHALLKDRAGLKQLVFIGSAIAGERADPEGASYCATKHALQGLVTSVQEEQRHLSNMPPTDFSASVKLPPMFDLRLYSPGYMNTGLLPKNAWPRYKGNVLEPELVAQDLLDWLADPGQVRCHRRFI